MYKRALMLTAATVALVAGPAYAAAPVDTITTKTTAKLTTSTAGASSTPADILITTATNANGTTTSTGSVEIPSSSNASTVAAIIINSSNNVTLADGTSLSFNGTTSAVGIQADTASLTGLITNGGTIYLTGTGTGKTGILIGDPLAATVGTFTGVLDTTDNTYFPADLTAIALQSGSTISVEGDGSTGIHLTTGDTLLGDVIADGDITVNATSLTSISSTGGAVTAIQLDGTMGSATTVSNLIVGPEGVISANGQGAQGIVVLGQVYGAILNEGIVETIGQVTSGHTTGNPEAGSALIVSNNVTGGIYNAGPGSSTNDTTIAATISSLGAGPAIAISPGAESTTAVAMTIGGYTDPLAIFGNVSFLNRGSISVSPTNIDTGGIAIAIAGASTSEQVTLTDGFVNSGAISATETTDSKATGNTVAAVSIGNYVILGGNTGTQTAFGNGYSFVNADERTGSGTISASISGASPGVADAIIIGGGKNSGTTLASIFNSGTISASATTTDTTIASLASYAIYDNSGTLTKITNSGTISATTTALDNLDQVAEAINLSSSTAATTITNTGTIIGDVYLGTGAANVTVSGSPAAQAALSGNIYFGGSANNVLTVDGGGQVIGKGAGAAVSGNILETVGGLIDITVTNGGILNITNDGLSANGTALRNSNGTLTTGAEPGVLVSALTVNNGATLGLTLSQPFNLNVAENDGSLVKSTGAIMISANSVVDLSFGSFVTSTETDPAKFIVFDAPSGMLTIANGASIQTAVSTNLPFLFSGELCTVNAATTGIAACTTPPETTTDSQLALLLTPKSPGFNANGTTDSTHIGLTGYAAKLFTPANAALAADSTLGAAVIEAGTGLTGTEANIEAVGQKLYQGVYSAFAPDVTGSDRAIAISLTDQSSGPVGARQRALRMYAGQDGEATIWGQEFTQRLNISNAVTAGGYSNTGFGFVFGADSGNPQDGRYGGAFTFYSGDTTEKAPRTSKTTSEWFMGTGYSDWRGHGLFLDTQLSAAYGQITGKRSLVIDDVTQTTAQGKRGAALIAGGVTAGSLYHAGGTVFIPQISLDGLTMREEGYTESNSSVVTQATNGFDLHVKPYYASSARAFLGADLRQDLRFSDFFLQPELRAGYRYDLLNGAQKLRAEFACSTVTNGCADTAFSITGPDPAHGNIVAGGGVAVTTGAWSIGLNYDYIRGIGGTEGVNQTGTIQLIGRI